MSPYIDDRVECGACSATGYKTSLITKPCEYCEGVGKRYQEAWDDKKQQSVKIPKLCFACYGKKTKLVSETDWSLKCDKCNGLGYLLKKKKIKSARQKAWSNWLTRNENGLGMIAVFLLVILILWGFVGCFQSML